MGQSARTWGAVISTAALIAGSVGTAVAVSSPSSAPKKPAVTAGHTAATADATVKSVRAWQQFRIRGVVKSLRPGSRVTLQQKQHGQWTTLPASVRTTSRSTYSMRVVLGMKGHNKLRLVDSRKRVVSPVINVRVR
ncbi:hypothetical protein [Streptomyces lavendofoliae]|uniref:Secreted protein n=1 Tax=Streptomyces lavendofoliae TaxID=67314 RepID=A0A918M679_9ACTN|nr:hypothetical protein [Streptomyces lavendofoliae]GGU48948.1 hypothetical protein GCM10010274_41760 [Streptomyces lavendofoliae]